MCLVYGGVRVSVDEILPMGEIKTASCSCGQLILEVQGEPLRASVCHCYECQKRTGSVFGAQLRFDRDKVRVVGKHHCFQRTADSGNRIETAFCPECGSTLLIRMLTMPEVVAVPMGSFAGEFCLQPNYSVYEARMPSWLSITGELEHID